MNYFNRITKLNIKNYDFSNFKVDWEYSINSDDTVATLNLTLFNLSDKTMELIKKGSQIRFYYGYNYNPVIFFTGIIDSYSIENGITKKIKISCFEYSKTIFKKISRSYEKNTTSQYVIEDICKQCALNLKEIFLEKNIKYKNGYNVYDMPLIALKKIVLSCGSKLRVNGDNVYIFKEKIGNSTGIEFNFDSGLLTEPNTIQSSIAKEQDEDDKKEKYTLPNSTHIVTTLANPEVKKFDLIKVLGIIYKVNSINISNWKSVMEVSKIG